MGRYFKVSAFTSLFCIILLYNFIEIFKKNHVVVGEIVTKSQENFEHNFIIIVAACLIVHVFPMYFYEKIKEKNRVLGIIVAVYNMPVSIVANIVTLVYGMVLIANLKYLGLKDEYILKKPEINSLKLKKCEKLSEKSQEIKKLIRNIKENKGDKTILKNIDELYESILNNEISQNFDKDGYRTQSIFGDIFLIERYSLEQIKSELESGKSRKGTEEYIKLWDVNRKLLRSREKGYLGEVVAEASISKTVDFYFENRDKLDHSLIKSIEFEKINRELKSSFEASYVFEFYYMNGIIDPLETGMLQKPFINNVLMKKAMEAKYMSIFEQYDNPEEKIVTSYDWLLKSPGLTAPVTVFIMKISNPNIENYTSRNRAARTKLFLMEYVAKSNGKIMQNNMPYSFVTGEHLKLEETWKENKKVLQVKVVEKKSKNGKEKFVNYQIN